MKVILILKCRDCHQELNRTPEITEEEAKKARLLSGLAAHKCPNGCRSTFTDLNLNTEIEEVRV